VSIVLPAAPELQFADDAGIYNRELEVAELKRRGFSADVALCCPLVHGATVSWAKRPAAPHSYPA
jgi:hypothetical protein